MLINLCYCLTNGESEFIPDLRGISKHLMLLFNIAVDQKSSIPFFISKHLMLLFNALSGGKRISYAVFQNISCYCLTAPALLRFTDVYAFQNISCYCLTLTASIFLRHYPISKHLMLLFNHYFPVIQDHLSAFQNISCYCLTYVVFSKLFETSYFKTSHVIV